MRHWSPSKSRGKAATQQGRILRCATILLQRRLRTNGPQRGVVERTQHPGRGSVRAAHQHRGPAALGGATALDGGPGSRQATPNLRRPRRQRLCPAPEGDSCGTPQPRPTAADRVAGWSPRRHDSRRRGCRSSVPPRVVVSQCEVSTCSFPGGGWSIDDVGTSRTTGDKARGRSKTTSSIRYHRSTPL